MNYSLVSVPSGFTTISDFSAFLVSAKFGPPAAGTPGRGRARVLPESFTLMVVERYPATH